MKIGTVKWFKRDTDSFIPTTAVPMCSSTRPPSNKAGMSDLKAGQRVIFETQRDERTGDATAVSLEPLLFATTPHLDGRFVTTNPFDIISAFISSAVSQFEKKAN
jgi:cold shock CspA family protein